MTSCQKLQEVNKDAFNTFQLRVGIRFVLRINIFNYRDNFHEFILLLRQVAVEIWLAE